MKLAAAVLLLSTSVALAHEDYTGKTDPVTKSGCCGGHDCAVLQVEPGVLTPEGDGFRLRLTEAQAKLINPERVGPVDTYIPRERVQESWTGQFRLCIPARLYPTMEADFYCFWEPNSM